MVTWATWVIHLSEFWFSYLYQVRVPRKTAWYLECSKFLANAGCYKSRIYLGRGCKVRYSVFSVAEGEYRVPVKRDPSPLGLRKGFPLAGMC